MQTDCNTGEENKEELKERMIDWLLKRVYTFCFEKQTNQVE